MSIRPSLVSTIVLASLASALATAQEFVEGVAHRPGIDLHYRVYGDKGPYVILLTGGPGLAPTMLRPVAEHLKDRFRCVLLEQRGSGRSRPAKYDKETVNYGQFMADVDAVRERLGQKKVILVGNSWGMMLSLAYAANYPKRAMAVATLGSGFLTADQAATKADTEAKRMADGVQKAVAEPEGVTPEERAFNVGVARMSLFVYDRDFARRFAESLRPPVGGVAGEFRADDSGEEVAAAFKDMVPETEAFVYRKLGRIACPVLVVHGRQDASPEEVAYTVRDGVKGAKVVFVSKCAHVPWFEQPEETWKTLDVFLRPFAFRKTVAPRP